MEQLTNAINVLTEYVKKTNSQIGQLTQEKWLFESLEKINKTLEEIKTSIENIESKD